jgi:hypothetical protein
MATETVVAAKASVSLLSPVILAFPEEARSKE